MNTTNTPQTDYETSKRIIEAAPELLAALKELLEAAEEMPIGTMRQHCGVALRVARAAIFNAEKGSAK